MHQCFFSWKLILCFVKVSEKSSRLPTRRPSWTVSSSRTGSIPLLLPGLGGFPKIGRKIPNLSPNINITLKKPIFGLLVVNPYVYYIICNYILEFPQTEFKTVANFDQRSFAFHMSLWKPWKRLQRILSFVVNMNFIIFYKYVLFCYKLDYH